MKYCWYKTSTCCLERICIEPFFYTRGNVKSSSWKLMEDINVAVHQSSFIFAFIIKISALSNITLYRTFISVILVNSWSLKQLYIYIHTHSLSLFTVHCPHLHLSVMMPITGLPDGSLRHSQRVPLQAHVGAVEWVTWTNSRWCSLGMRGLIHPLSLLSMQSIIIPPSLSSPPRPSRVFCTTILCAIITFVQENVSLLSLGLFIQGASGSEATCSLDRDPWGTS